MLVHAALSWVFLEGCSRYLSAFFHLQLLPLLTCQHFAESDAVGGAARSDWELQQKAGCCGCSPALAVGSSASSTFIS